MPEKGPSMTPEQLASEVERIDKLMSPGPWRSIPSKLRPQYPAKINQILAHDGPPVVNWSGFDNSDVPFKQHKANANGIAALRNLLPAIAAALRSPHGDAARVKRLEEALRRLFDLTEEALASAASGGVVMAGGVEAVTHVSFPTTTTEARAIIESASAALASETGEGEQP